jgi:hypothetical protein
MEVDTEKQSARTHDKEERGKEARDEMAREREASQSFPTKIPIGRRRDLRARE